MMGLIPCDRRGRTPHGMEWDYKVGGMVTKGSAQINKAAAVAAARVGRISGGPAAPPAQPPLEDVPAEVD